MRPKLSTSAQQGAAPDRLQLRSSFLLAALPAAGELSRWAALRSVHTIVMAKLIDVIFVISLLTFGALVIKTMLNIPPHGTMWIGVVFLLVAGVLKGWKDKRLSP
jgi:hypothetical protein